MTILENMSIADNKGKRYGLGGGLNRKRKDRYAQMLRPLNLGLENKLDTKVGALSGRTEAGTVSSYVNDDSD